MAERLRLARNLAIATAFAVGGGLGALQLEKGISIRNPKDLPPIGRTLFDASLDLGTSATQTHTVYDKVSLHVRPHFPQPVHAEQELMKARQAMIDKKLDVSKIDEVIRSIITEPSYSSYSSEVASINAISKALSKKTKQLRNEVALRSLLSVLFTDLGILGAFEANQHIR